MEEKRNLIHIVNGNRMAGIQTYALDICRHYRDCGWNTFAVTRGSHAVDSHFASEGISIVHAPLRGVFDLGSALKLARLLRSVPAGDCVIHVHRYRDAFTAIIAKRLSKRRNVRIVASRHAVRKGRDSLLFRNLYAKIDAHIFVSDMAYERFCRSWSGRRIPLPRNTVFILHNSLNISDAGPLPEPEKGPVTALYHGPIATGKGLETLIDAMSILRDIKLRLIIAGTGSPDLRDSLRRRAMTRGVMELIDWNTSCDNPVPLIAKSHFGVVPSVEREAFGMGSLRFMAYGRPQVTTLNGAQAEYLRDGKSALLVAPADAGALAEAMRELASDAGVRRTLGANAWSEFSRFLSWDAFTRNLDNIYVPHLRERKQLT